MKIHRVISLLILVAVAQTLPTRTRFCELARAVEPPLQTTQQVADRLTTTQLRTAIDRAAQYLTRNCDADGRFTYRIHLDPEIRLRPSYNVLRHAGSIYALATYQLRSPHPETRAAVLRSAAWLRAHCVAPVAGNDKIKAVWSSPDVASNLETRQAKLGGAGLGLVALLSVEKISPHFTPLEELRSLGRFLIYMQKADGSFYSKYTPADGGRDDRWQSSYYPGEAALGLLMLYQADPTAKWLGAAARAQGNLARRGSLQQTTFPDQWFLLAAQRLMPYCQRPEVPFTDRLLLAHTRHVCSDMMANQQLDSDQSALYGCYTSDGRTCPTATRLEGLLAAYEYLPDSDQQLRDRLWESVQHAMRFLVRCQITTNPHTGAFTRVCPQVYDALSPAETPPRAAEVRIDYVQHALSAMLQYEAILERR